MGIGDPLLADDGNPAYNPGTGNPIYLGGSGCPCCMYCWWRWSVTLDCLTHTYGDITQDARKCSDLNPWDQPADGYWHEGSVTDAVCTLYFVEKGGSHCAMDTDCDEYPENPYVPFYSEGKLCPDCCVCCKVFSIVFNDCGGGTTTTVYTANGEDGVLGCPDDRWQGPDGTSEVYYEVGGFTGDAWQLVDSLGNLWTSAVLGTGNCFSLNPADWMCYPDCGCGGGPDRSIASITCNDELRGLPLKTAKQSALAPPKAPAGAKPCAPCARKRP